MYDCVVVGGGLIGMMTARQLGREGMKVLVIDQGPLGSESSWAGGGILSPLYPWRYSAPISELALYSHQHYQAYAEALHEESGIDPQWTRTGLLILDTDERQAAVDWATKYHWTLQALKHVDEIKQLEPGLATTKASAFWLPEVAQLRNPRLVKSLKGSLEHYQIDYAEHEAVLTLEQSDHRISGVRTEKRLIPADSVIVTAGAWSTAILNNAGVNVAVEPVRGQMLIFKAEPGVVNHTVLAQDHYLIPRRDGRVLIGSTLEYVGFDKSTTAVAREELTQRAIALIPELAQYPIEKHWSGLRPGSPEGMPYIGADKDVEGLYYNCGHFRNGVILGLASVTLLTDILHNRPAFMDAESFLAVGH